MEWAHQRCVFAALTVIGFPRAGTSIALAGVFAYSQVKRSANKKAVAVVPAKDLPAKEL